MPPGTPELLQLGHKVLYGAQRPSTASKARPKMARPIIVAGLYLDLMFLRQPTSSARRGQRASAEAENTIKPVARKTETVSAGSLRPLGQIGICQANVRATVERFRSEPARLELRAEASLIGWQLVLCHVKQN